MGVEARGFQPGTSTLHEPNAFLSWHAHFPLQIRQLWSRQITDSHHLVTDSHFGADRLLTLKKRFLTRTCRQQVERVVLPHTLSLIHFLAHSGQQVEQWVMHHVASNPGGVPYKRTNLLS